MLINDSIKLAVGAISSQRMRSFLTALGIAVGIASVVLLTSIGEGIHRFVLSEFTQFGTNLMAVSPGKTTTAGMSGAVISNVRPLSIDDALALERNPRVLGMVPFIQGNAPVEFGKRSRRVYVFGVNSQVPDVWQMKVAVGRFLPDDDPRTARAFAVLGKKVRDELFGVTNPLGRRIRIGGERFRIVGVMEPKGQMLGFDLDDAVYIPTARALAMFDRESLMEIDLTYAPGSNVSDIAKSVKAQLMERHGLEDFTITTQEQMLEVMGSVLDILTLAVGALGGISLLVGGVGILTIMTISVNERRAEIGLFRAIGATRHRRESRTDTHLFHRRSRCSGEYRRLCRPDNRYRVLGATVPALPTHTPWLYVFLAEILAVVIGLLAGVLPALKAANLDPIEALRAE